MTIPTVVAAPSTTPLSILAILNTFVERAKWANELLTLSQSIFDAIESNIVEITIVKQAVDISLTHLRHHSNGIIKSLENTAVAVKSLNENSESVANWQAALEVSSKLPVHKSLLSGHSTSTHLSDWIDKEEINKTSQKLEKDRAKITSLIDRLYTKADEMLAKVQALESSARTWFSAPVAPIASQEDLLAPEFDESWKGYKDLAEDVATLVQKIESDCSYVATLSDTPQNVHNALRITKLHEREFLPKAQDVTKELWAIHKAWAVSKSFHTQQSIKLLRTVSQIQFFSSPLRQQISELSTALKAAESDRIAVARAIDMPYLYGALLFELIRRDEWMDHMKARVNRTAEMMAGWREDEIKRRTKWIRQLGGSLGMLKRIGGGGSSGPGNSSDVPDVEITIINSKEHKSYSLTRRDIDQYLQLVKSFNLEEEFAELSALVAKTDKINPFPEPIPVEHQQMQQQVLKRQSVFKEGNVSEYSKSLLLAKSIGLDTPLHEPPPKSSNNSTIKLSDDPSKEDFSLAPRIQIYEARIRKLEDLLHRNQFQNSWTNKFQSPGTASTTTADSTTYPPKGDSGSEASGTGSGTNISQSEYQFLVEKIKLLEEEVQSKGIEIGKLKAENKTLSEEITAKNTSLEEAQVMKTDLIANLSTKDGEFNAERRSFQEEIDELKIKIYDLEIDIEHEIEKRVTMEDDIQYVKHQYKQKTETFKRTLQHQRKLISIAEHQALKAQTQYDVLATRARELSQRLYTSTVRNSDLLGSLGLQIHKEYDEEDGGILSFKIQRVKGLGRRTRSALSAAVGSEGAVEEEKSAIDPTVLYWIDSPSDEEDEDDVGKDDDDDNVFDDDDDLFDLHAIGATITQNTIDSGSLISSGRHSIDESIVSLQESGAKEEKPNSDRADSGNNDQANQGTKTESTESNPDSAESSTKPSSLYSSNYEQRRQLKRLERQQRLQQQQNGIPFKDQSAFEEEQRRKNETREIKKADIMQKRLDVYRRRANARTEPKYRRFLQTVYIDYDLFRVSVTKRFSDVEHLARKLQKECRGYRERAHLNEQLSRGKLAYKSFKQGDLALFLPTRDQTRDPNPWAAFNVGAPHFFLKPSPEHRLFERDWLVARITKIEEWVVDRAHGSEKDNPFDLSDGLKWHLLEATEER